MSNKTPGYNCRLKIAFTTIKGGKSVAYYESRSLGGMRWIRMGYDQAKLFVAQGQADEVPYIKNS
jgi:hypothetical protein